VVFFAAQLIWGGGKKKLLGRIKKLPNALISDFESPNIKSFVLLSSMGADALVP